MELELWDGGGNQQYTPAAQVAYPNNGRRSSPDSIESLFRSSLVSTRGIHVYSHNFVS